MHSTAKFVPESHEIMNGFVVDVHMEAHIYPGRRSPTLILALMEE